MVPVFWTWPLRTPPDTQVIWVALLKSARQTLELVSFLNLTGSLPLPSSIEIESICLLNRSSICQSKSRLFTSLTESWTYTLKSKFNTFDLFSTALPVSSKSVGFNSSGVIFTCLILRAVSLSGSVTLPKCLGLEYSFNPIIVERELVSVLLSLEPLDLEGTAALLSSDETEPEPSVWEIVADSPVWVESWDELASTSKRLASYAAKVFALVWSAISAVFTVSVPLLFWFIPFKPTSDKSEPPLSELVALVLFFTAADASTTLCGCVGPVWLWSVAFDSSSLVGFWVVSALTVLLLPLIKVKPNKTEHTPIFNLRKLNLCFTLSKLFPFLNIVSSSFSTSKKIYFLTTNTF